ncbi:MAG: hypothetical protein IKP28_06845 [Clostridia bacterium]|nr:hypothetical protein [Clostridia bacterium]
MKKKLYVTIILIIVLTALSLGNSFAASPFALKITADKTTVKQGDTVKLTVSLSNVTVEDGIGALTGVMKYDTEVFEKIELDETGMAEEIENAKGWESINYNDGSQSAADAGIFLTNTSSGMGVKKDAPVMYVTLKVRSTAKDGNTTITLSNIVGSDSNQDLEAQNTSINIKIGSGKTEGNNTTNDTTKNNTTTNNDTTKNNTTTNNDTTKNNTTKNNDTTKNDATKNDTTKNEATTNNTSTANENTNKSASNSSSSKTNNTTGKTLPYAGNSETILLAALIIAFIAGIAFMRCKQMKNI